MPTLPQANRGGIALRPRAAVRLPAARSPQAYGAAQGAALNSIILKAKARADNANINEAVAKARKLRENYLYNPEDGISVLQGKALFAAVGERAQSYGEEIQALIGNLPAGLARDAGTRALNSELDSFVTSAQRYEGPARRRYEWNNYVGALESTVTDTVRQSGEPGAMFIEPSGEFNAKSPAILGKAKIVGQIQLYARLNKEHLPMDEAEWVKSQIADVMGPMHDRVVTQLVEEGMVVEATKYIVDNLHEMTPEAADKANNKIDLKTFDSAIDQGVSAAHGAHPIMNYDSPTKAFSAARTAHEAEMEKAGWTASQKKQGRLAFAHEKRRLQAIFEDEQDDTFTDMLQWLNSNGGKMDKLKNLKKDEWDLLGMGNRELRQALAAESATIQGNLAQKDIDLNYYGYRKVALHDPQKFLSLNRDAVMSFLGGPETKQSKAIMSLFEKVAEGDVNTVDARIDMFMDESSIEDDKPRAQFYRAVQSDIDAAGGLVAFGGTAAIERLMPQLLANVELALPGLRNDIGGDAYSISVSEGQLSAIQEIRPDIVVDAEASARSVVAQNPAEYPPGEAVDIEIQRLTRFFVRQGLRHGLWDLTEKDALGFSLPPVPLTRANNDPLDTESDAFTGPTQPEPEDIDPYVDPKTGKTRRYR